MPDHSTRKVIAVVALAMTMALGIVLSAESDPTPKVSQSSSESNYGGLSVGPNDNYIVNVHMLNPSQEAAEALAEQHLDPAYWRAVREVRAVRVRYSKSQLDGWFHILSNDMGVWEEFPELTSMGASVTEDHVSVGVACGAALPKVERSIRERMGAHGIPQSAVVFEVSGRIVFAVKPAPPFDYECLPPEVQDPDTGLSTPGFGGMYIGSDAVFVYMLEPSRRQAEKLAVAYFGRKIVEEAGGVKAVRGQYTWEQLQEWWRLILDGIWDIRGASPCEVDYGLNRITIEVTKEYNKNVVEEVEEWLAEVGAPRGAVVFLEDG